MVLPSRRLVTRPGAPQHREVLAHVGDLAADPVALRSLTDSSPRRVTRGRTGASGPRVPDRSRRTAADRLGGDRKADPTPVNGYQCLRKLRNDSTVRGRAGARILRRCARPPTAWYRSHEFPIGEVEAARDRIGGLVHRTPLLVVVDGRAWVTACIRHPARRRAPVPEGGASPEDGLLQGARDDRTGSPRCVPTRARAARSRCRPATRARPTRGRAERRASP